MLAGDVVQAAAIVHELDSVQQLLLYVTPISVDAAALRALLRRTLPAHAMPNRILPLDAMPTNAAGKLDRAALPRPPVTASLPRPTVDAWPVEPLATPSVPVPAVPSVPSVPLGDAARAAAGLDERARRIEEAIGLPVRLNETSDE